MQWFRMFTSHKLLASALLSSLGWFLFWVVMAPVERDIADIFNWYFFMKLQASRVYNVYAWLAWVHHWMPLLLLTLAGLTRLASSLNSIAQVTFAIAIVFNSLLLLYMLLAGGKVMALFSLALPLRLTLSLGPWIYSLLLPHRLFIPVSVLIGAHFICTPKSENGVRTNSRFWRRLLVTVGLPLFVSLLGWLIMYKGCKPCSSLDTGPPPRPRLIAHRGCGGDNPENTLAAFERAVEIPLMVGLETDIQISCDGIPFLLHDTVPARTTNIREKCPAIDPWVNASTLAYSTGDCPLTKLNVGTWEHKDDVAHSSETVPTAGEYLDIAKRSGKVVIFDVIEPPVGHTHHTRYLNITLEAIVNSGIEQSKVWWLPKQNRDWVIAHHPRISQITKTTETLFEDFEAEHIVRINDDWTTPIETFRGYQAANISINMYFVDSPLMYSYAWCLGAESVTTDHCTELAHLTTNPLYQVCAAWSRGLHPSSLWAWSGLSTLGLMLALVIFWDKLLCKR